MNCCKCSGTLNLAKSTKGADFHWCSFCKGLWLSHNSLSIIYNGHPQVKRLLSAGLSHEAAVDFNCPDCQRSMKNGKVLDSEIIIEECSHCKKYFFDEREINQVLDFIKASELPQGKHIDWSKESLVTTSENCPSCVEEPLFGIDHYTDKIEACLKCNGVATTVEALQTIVKKSLFGPSMFEFRRGGGIIAYCRFCNLPQSRKNSNCQHCARSLSGIKCHKCQSRFSEYQLGEVVIDRCQMCNSVWLDRGEFEKVMTIMPDLKKQMDREYLQGKLSEVRTDAISTIYSHSIEQSRRDMITGFWGPFGALVFF